MIKSYIYGETVRLPIFKTVLWLLLGRNYLHFRIALDENDHLLHAEPMIAPKYKKWKD